MPKVIAPRQRPSQPGALRPARHSDDGLRDLEDHGVDRARGPEHSWSTCSSSPRRTSRSSRCRSRRNSPVPATTREVQLPEGARLISVKRNGQSARGRGDGVGRATRCWRSSSPAKRTSSAGCYSRVVGAGLVACRGGAGGPGRPSAGAHAEAARDRARPAGIRRSRRRATRGAYVVERGGAIRDVGGGRAQPFLDIRSKVSRGGEQGLLSVAFHPNYARNRRIYVDYTDPNGDTHIVEYRTNRTRATARPRAAALRRPAVREPQRRPARVRARRQALRGLGDGGSGGDPDDRAPEPRTTMLGKLLRIDADALGARRRSSRYGLRNPWRFSFDRANGDLWIGDVGQSAGRRSTTRRARDGGSANYGWNAYEGTHDYKAERALDRTPSPRSSSTRTASGCSITGGFVWKGRYYYGDHRRAGSGR